MNSRIALSCLIAALFTVTAYAKGVAINPGQWEMTSTMTMTMMPQPRTTSNSECITVNELGPDEFNMDKDNPCAITDVIIDGNNARWSINCSAADGLEMAGQWEFTSSGNSITGSGSMTADVAGQKMGFNMTWDGKRIGDCEQDG